LGVVALALAFVLSLAPVALRLLADAGWAPEGVSLLGLALLPWIALAGLPRAAARAPAALGLALPALALAWSMDTRGGAPAAEGLWTLGFGALLILLLERAANAGARGRRELHGGVWLALVPGLVLLGAIAGGGWLGAAADVSPLTWSWTRAAAPAEPGLAGAPLGPLAVALVLWALAGRAREDQA
jgi:hypothetical protein